MVETAEVGAMAAAGAQLLDALRARGQERPPIDPSLAQRLRGDLEAVAVPASELPDGVVVRLSKQSLRKVLLCERHHVATLGANAAPTPDTVRGQLLDLLFAQVVSGVAPGPRPVEDALAAAEVNDDRELPLAWSSLTDDDREELAYTVPVLARELASRWPRLPANAWPRLQDSMTVELAGGRVVLAGRVDLVLGQPSAERVGVTLVDVKSGNRRHDDQQDAAWYALLETLRSRVAPLQVGNYYLQDGTLQLDPATDEMLQHQVTRVTEGIRRMIRLHAGGEPSVAPSGLCPWCPALSTCGPGRRQAEEQGYAPDDRVGEDDDDQSAAG